MVILIMLVLLISYISVEASSGDDFLGSDQFRINPLLERSTPSLPFDGDVNKVLTQAPVAFTENQGQIENEDIRFYEQGGGIWFTDDGVYIEVREELDKKVSNKPETEKSFIDINHKEPPQFRRVVLKQTFIDANYIIPEGQHQCTWNSNFFLGNEPSKWRTDVPNYYEIYYENIYDGIDLKYSLNENGLKSDIIVNPGADISQIRMRYEGANRLEIDNSGNLIIKNAVRDISEGKLFVYQDYTGRQLSIRSKFLNYNNLEYCFEILEEYNKNEILVIDPVLEYSTYIGGINNDYGNKITVDDTGNAYVTGYTYSNNFPTKVGSYDTNFNGGLYDIFVLKLNPDGSSLNYSTFIGGSNNEQGLDIAVDSQGNTYLTGDTRSNNFPTVNAYDSTFNSAGDVFVLKLNPTGSSLLFSTYIGSMNVDYGYGIAIDSKGCAFVTGFTWFTSSSFKFPTTLGAYDRIGQGGTEIFVLKLNYSGSALDYSTHVAGSLNDGGYGLAVDSNGSAYVTGYTYSTNFPTSPSPYDPSHNGERDAFVLKLNHNGSSLQYSTFLGGSNDERGYGIALDSNRNAIVTGYTESSTFPNTTGAFKQSHNGNKDVFISKLNQTGASLKFSTFVGGSGDDEGHDLTIDSSGNIIVTGDTTSSTFPTSNDAYDNAYNSSEAYFLKLSSDGTTLIYSSYLGGTSSDYARSIDLDIMQNIYVTGYTNSSNFPTTTGAYNETFNGGYDVFVVKFATTPFINITSLSLLENNQPTSDIYSRYRPYTFRVQILDTVGVSDLGAVRLTLDPVGSNIRLKWDRLTEVFSELSDPNNYISIHPSSKAYSNFIWTIDFNVTFNWNYPDENLHNVQVYATSAKLSPAWLNTTDIYKVENDLVFNGTLSVNGEDNRTIHENTLVRGGEVLKWTGLIPVYENTLDIYPPDEEFNVTIWDDEDLSWTVSPASGVPFIAETITPDMTYNTSFTYTIKLSDVPPICDMTNESFTIMLSRIPPESDKTNETFDVFIDADNVTFLDIIPSNTTWQTNSNVLVGVNITDVGGGEVDGNTVMYAISTNNGATWDVWEPIIGLTSDVTIQIKDTVTLIESKDNLIKWRAADSVGNGPSESEPYRILVDTNDVEFSNAWPSALEVSKTEEVEVGITISDETSGVDASTIQYSVSENKGKNWSGWKNVKSLQNGVTVAVRINLTLPNSTDNMLRWRAYDIAGNGPEESTWQIINVNNWVPQVKPKVILLSPPNGITINDTSIELTWELEDNSSKGVTYNVYFDNFSNPGIKTTGVLNTSFVIDDLVNGKTYYWRVIPILGDLEGSCISGIWWFEIDLVTDSKMFKLKLTGRDSISIFPGENKSVPLSITNLGTNEDLIKFELEAGKLSDYIALDDNSMVKLASNNYAFRNLEISLPETIQPGIHVIIITAISMNSGGMVRDSHVIEIEIKEQESTKPDESEINGTEGNVTKEKSTQGLSEIWVYSIIVVVIIIILCIILAAFIVKRKKRVKQEFLLPGTITIKPGALTAPVISVGQVPAVPKLAQLPSATTVGISQQSTIQPTIAPQITQVPQLPQLPQLPPAQTPAPTVGSGDPETTPVPTLATTPTTPAQATPTQTTAPTVTTPTIVQQPGTPPIPAVITSTTTPPAAGTQPTIQSTGPTVHLPASTAQPTIAQSSQPSPTVAQAQTQEPNVKSKTSQNKNPES